MPEEQISDTIRKMFPDLIALRTKHLNDSEETTPAYKCEKLPRYRLGNGERAGRTRILSRMFVWLASKTTPEWPLEVCNDPEGIRRADSR